MSERLGDYEVDGLARAAAHTVPGGRRLLLLAREVQSSRKLIADLLALHQFRKGREYDYCTACIDAHWPCPTVRLIEEASHD